MGDDAIFSSSDDPQTRKKPSFLKKPKESNPEKQLLSAKMLEDNDEHKKAGRSYRALHSRLWLLPSLL